MKIFTVSIPGSSIQNKGEVQALLSHVAGTIGIKWKITLNLISSH
jgi:hypothetical protein